MAGEPLGATMPVKLMARVKPSDCPGIFDGYVVAAEGHGVVVCRGAPVGGESDIVAGRVWAAWTFALWFPKG